MLTPYYNSGDIVRMIDQMDEPYMVLNDERDCFGMIMVNVLKLTTGNRLRLYESLLQMHFIKDVP